MAEIGFVPMVAGGAVKCGTYTGDGSASRTINLGVTPKWVILCNREGQFVNTYPNYAACGGIALQGYPCKSTYFNVLQIVNGGFEVYCDSGSGEYVYTNSQNDTYYFIYGI